MNPSSDKSPPILKVAKHSPILFLNLTQFFSILNDNLYKLFMVFLLIRLLGQGSSNTILSAAGAVFVIPFILFSSSAGILADRYSKQRFLVVMKIFEICVMVSAIFVFYSQSVFGCYFLLFLLATHSALFGPPKYSIIPELVPQEMVPKANGLITSFAYIAIIVGTFLASFITQMTGYNFIFAASCCVLVAITGFLLTLKIPKTKAQGSTKKLKFFFIGDVFRTLIFASHIRHLITAVLGSSYFLFVGSFTQLNIIPYAIESLSLSTVAGGYLFLSTAIGIAIGSLIAGQILKKRLDLGLSCLAGFAVSLLFLCLYVFATSLPLVIVSLVALGIFGGLYVVPFDSFIQVRSPDQNRGQVIGAGNFLGFFGVLLASGFLYLLGSVLGLSSAKGFGVIACITFLVSIVLTLKLSDYAFFNLAHVLLYPFYKIQYSPLPEKGLLILEKPSLKEFLLLLGSSPGLLYYFVTKHSKLLYWRCKFCYSFRTLPLTKNIDIFQNIEDGGQSACVVITKKTDEDTIKKIKIDLKLNLFKAHFQITKGSGIRKNVTITFSEG